MQPRIISPLEALDMGWSIIPCNKNKTPMLTSWKEYQSRQPTREEIEQWIKRNPPAWAIITGAVSRRFTLDFDGDRGRQTMEVLKLPSPHRRTPNRGFHSDFTTPAYRVRTLNSKIKAELANRWPGLDLRGDGAYAIFLGRIDGADYEWISPPEAHPFDLLPADLIDFIKPPIKEPQNFTEYAAERHAAELMNEALKRAPKGRNKAGFWLAGQLRDHGLTQDGAAEIMEEYRRLCPITNTKGEQEEYTQAEYFASLDQAYRQPARGPYLMGGKPAPAPKPNGAAHDSPTPAPATHKTQFICTPSAVYHVGDEDPQTGERPKTYVCSRLEVVATARDANSESWGRLLRWWDSAGKEHTWICPMRMLAGDGIQFRETLADGGLEIGYGPKTNTLLTQYVRSEKPLKSIYCIPHVGWFFEAEPAFVFPEAVIPHAAEVGYQSAGRGEHFYRSRGTLATWRENVGEKCAGNSRLIFAVSAAFAGPLMRPLGVQGGGFHFCGTSSTGKSTTQWVAGSVWGGGGRNGFARTWSATKNALESTAELHNDGCLILDEIRMIDPREVEQIVYMLANGSGKSRETRNLTGRRTLQWLCIVLSSGEIQLADCAALAGQKTKGGAEIRMCTIPADAGKWGMFETLNGTDDPRIFAETLVAASKENYGTAITEFIAALIDDWDHKLIECRQFIEDFIADNLPAGAAPEIRRVLQRFAVVAAAGELATELGITGWREGDAADAGRVCFEAWIENRGGTDATDTINAMLQVRGIIAQDHSRFRPADPEKNAEGQILVQDRIQHALGYWKRMPDNELLYLVDQDAFRRELCAGFDPRIVLEELRRRKLLHLNEGSGRWTARLEVTLPSGDIRKLRFYAIRAAILDFAE